MSDTDHPPLMTGTFFGACLAASVLMSGCTVITIASTVVSAGATVVGAGVSVGAAVAKGTIKMTKAVANAATDDPSD